MQFSTTSGAKSPTDLIPSGFLCWAMLTFRGMKGSQSGGRYADLEFTIADKQPFARKKLWSMVGDPDFEGNSEAYRNMGMVALTRMVEAAGVVNPANPDSYQQLNGLSCEKVMMMLDGKYVAMRVSIENGQDGYADKNKVGDFLTPNEQSTGYKPFVKLTNGDHGNLGPGGKQAAQSGGSFGGGANRASTSANVSQGAFGQRGVGVSETERPVPQAETQQAQSRSGFNPNSAPTFLREAQR